MCAGAGGSGGFRSVLVQEVLEGFRFRRVPASSGVCWCRFRKQVPEGLEGSVPEGSRKVLESSGVVCCLQP